MCKFRITVTLCGCHDPDCRQRPSALGQLNSPAMKQNGGHVFRIKTYFREGPLCMEYFVNEDPDRLVVKEYDMDPSNANSKQDCRKRVFIIDPGCTHLDFMCDSCKHFCWQPAPSTASSSVGLSTL